MPIAIAGTKSSGAFVYLEIDFCRRISQNFSPAGVTSPFAAKAMPTDAVSVVPVSGR